MKTILAALLFTLPTLAVALDLEGYYITPKVGASQSFNTGSANYTDERGVAAFFQGEDLGTGTAFGFSVGKYLTDNFRLELEAIKRTDYEYSRDQVTSIEENTKLRAKIETHALFINGFYNFQPFSIVNTSITPYLGGGLGVSRNKMDTNYLYSSLGGAFFIDGDSINQFAHKLSAGILVSLTDKLSLDVNYQYVDLGEFESGTVIQSPTELVDWELGRGFKGGRIKSQEIMFGLQYKFN